jgi:CBS domain-containing protein
MLSRHFMVRSEATLATLLETATLGEAIAHMCKQRRQQLLIVNENNEYIGEITSFTLAKLLLPEGSDGQQSREEAELETVGDIDARIRPHLYRRVSEFAGHDNPIVHPDTPLVETLALLVGGRLRIPVVDEKTNKLVGVISALTVLRHYQF